MSTKPANSPFLLPPFMFFLGDQSLSISPLSLLFFNSQKKEKTFSLNALMEAVIPNGFLFRSQNNFV